MSGKDNDSSEGNLTPLMASLALLYVACLVMLPSIWTGPPFGQSYVFNLNWYEGFAEQLWSGEVYPRWLSDAWGGMGAADFFFYGPLPFYILGLFWGICLGCEPDTAYVLGFTCIHFFSGLSFLMLARRFVPMNVALVGAISYLVIPFHVADSWYLRQAAGEFLAFALLPLVLYFYLEISKGGRFGGLGLAFSVALLGFSHLPSLVTTACFIGVALFVRLIRERDKIKESLSFVVQLGGWWLLGMCLVAFYWLPAVILLDDVSPHHFYMEHLLWQNWLFFDAKPEPFESQYGMMLKNYLIVSTVIAALCLWKGNEYRRQLWLWVVLPVATTWFFVTPLSWPAWEYLPVLDKIQLPYRFFYIFDLGMALGMILLVQTASTGQERWRGYLIGCILLFWVGTDFRRANGVSMAYMPAEGAAWVEEARDSRFGPAEYLSPTAVEKGILLKEEREELRTFMAIPEIQQSPSSAGVVEIEQVDSRHFIVNATVVEPVDLILKRQYWRYWEAELDGERFEDFGPVDPYGLTRFRLQEGTHQVVFRLPWLRAERQGAALSLFAWFCFLGLTARAVRSRTVRENLA